LFQLDGMLPVPQLRTQVQHFATPAAAVLADCMLASPSARTNVIQSKLMGLKLYSSVAARPVTKNALSLSRTDRVVIMSVDIEESSERAQTDCTT
jgi:hypothetical protein